MSRFQRVVSILFFAFLSGMITFNLPHSGRKPHPLLLKSLLTGSDQGYVPLGAQMKVFKPFLANEKRVSFITDYESGDSRKLHKSAQAYLCPLMLDFKPKEKTALVYCSTQRIAEKRIRELGYQWQKKFSAQTGIAQKI